jgi:hypothetical protein
MTGPIQEIIDLVEASAAAGIEWRDRGRAPRGYSEGMALMFARACCRLQAEDAVALEMAQAQGVDGRRDALAWYEAEFVQLGMSNAEAGADTLRHLFVLMIGLGMRESSGRHCEGRDASAQNTTAETAEAGLFQVSYNSISAHPYLSDLMARYAGSTDLQPIFSKGVQCSASAWRDWGEGPGRAFQALTKACPAFAVEYAGVAMRHIRTHWGPLSRRQAELRSEWDDLLRTIQTYVDQPDVCAALAKSVSSPARSRAPSRGRNATRK